MGESALDVLTREHDDLRHLFAQVRDPDADRTAAWFEVVKQVATHVAIERTFLYPVVKRRRLGSAHLAEELRRDYKRMEHLLVLTERRKINSPDMPELVTELLDVFEAHEARCATTLVSTMRDHLAQDELDELGAKMRAAEKVILSHPHPHLLALGPVYQWTTRIASRWDRVRDRTVQNR
ncbi:MAG TPA: hemerythrin domain-containing protein [Acidimicrobiales bacterium]|nr:hemerythrin domain-containing protein [Acidimicrobiales bacterium]